MLHTPLSKYSVLTFLPSKYLTLYHISLPLSSSQGVSEKGDTVKVTEGEKVQEERRSEITIIKTNIFILLITQKTEKTLSFCFISSLSPYEMTFTSYCVIFNL